MTTKTMPKELFTKESIEKAKGFAETVLEKLPNETANNEARSWTDKIFNQMGKARTRFWISIFNSPTWLVEKQIGEAYDKYLMNYHTDKKCKNCVLNGKCLLDDPEECDEVEEEEEED